jgi:predicted GIY-YIG superfamily endonuclease
MELTSRTPERYRQHAAEVRAKAARMCDPTAIRAMERIAKSAEALANSLERLAASRWALFQSSKQD